MQILKKILLRQTALASVLTGPAKLAIEQYRAVLRQEKKRDGDSAVSLFSAPFDPEEEKSPSVADEAQRSARLSANLAAMIFRSKTAASLRDNAEMPANSSAGILTGANPFGGLAPQTGLPQPNMPLRQLYTAWQVGAENGSMAEISRFFERDARRYGG